MTIRDLSLSEYAMVMRWFKERTGSALSPELLSTNGFLAELKDRPIACIFFFLVANCDIALFGWPIANPKSSPAERDVALDLLIEKVQAHSKELGYKYITSYSSKDSVSDRLGKNGFHVGDSSVTQYIKEL